MYSENNEISGFQNFARIFSMPPEFGQIEITPNLSGSVDLGAAIDKKMSDIYVEAAEKRGVPVDAIRNEVQDIVDEMREFLVRIKDILEEKRHDSPKTPEDRERFREILEDSIATIHELHNKMESALCIAKGETSD